MKIKSTMFSLLGLIPGMVFGSIKPYSSAEEGETFIKEDIPQIVEKNPAELTREEVTDLQSYCETAYRTRRKTPSFRSGI